MGMSYEHETLKACPFCGGSARIIETKPKPGQFVSRYVFCDGCGALWDTAINVSAKDLAERWNTRAPAITESVNP